MAYVDLTDQEKSDLHTGEIFIRGMLSTLVQSYDTELDWWDAVVQPILDQLAPGDVVPNSSGLAGAQDLTRAQLEAIKAWMQVDIADKVIANMSLVVEAIGINAG
jgi:hypothetical protein